MNDFPGFFQTYPFTLVYRQRVICRFQLDSRTVIAATKMRHRLQAVCVFEIISNTVGKPAEERSDIRRIEILQILIEVFALLRHPNTQPKRCLLAVDRDFQDSTDEEILVVDDASIRGQVYSLIALALALALGNSITRVRSIPTDIWKSFVNLITSGAAETHVIKPQKYNRGNCKGFTYVQQSKRAARNDAFRPSGRLFSVVILSFYGPTKSTGQLLPYQGALD